MGGALTYIKNVSRWLCEVAPDHQFLVCLPKETATTLAKYEDSTNLLLIEYPYESTSGISRLYFDQVAIPSWIEEKQIDVLFSSTGFGTFRSLCPEVLLVRNPIYFDKNFHAKYRELNRTLADVTLRRWYSMLSIYQADRVIFPTGAMQEMVEEYVALDSEDAEVIHYGFDSDKFYSKKPEKKSSIRTLNRIESWKKSGYKILLNVSAYAVHKNFETLVDALSLLAGDGHSVKLITTTSREKTGDKNEYDALQERIRDKGLSDIFFEVGYVPYEELSALYEAADIFVFPSFTESFGHSMVEAMASGLPIVAAETPVNREVCGYAALYFQTFSPESCATQIKRCIGDSGLDSVLAKNAKERAAKFSWRKHVEALVEVIETAKN
jgi:glycosyltransferase involved in cell wall biosynthesis